MSRYKKEITLLDSSFSVYGQPIKAWESLAYSDAWDKHGTISLVAEMDYFASLSGSSWMEIDGRVYEVETIQSDDADKTVKVTGCSLNVLFDRIVITSKERLQGRLEERIRYLVNKYAITGTQAVTGLELGTDNAYARAMDATTIQWQTLSEFLYTQLNQRGFSYTITCDCVTGALVFNITQAKDRTQDQTVNPPVQLSTTAEIEKATYKKSIKDFRNYAIVHDDDETNPQVVEVDLSNGAPKRVLPVTGKAMGADDSAATNLYVMVGTYSTGIGFIATSTDAQTWTTRVSTVIQRLWSVEYLNGVFLAGGDLGKVYTSSDGITWVERSTGSPYSIEGVTYDDGIYFAFASSGTIFAGEIYYSYDSITWNKSRDLPYKIVNSIKTKSGHIAMLSYLDNYYAYRTDYGTVWTEEINPLALGADGSVIARTCRINDVIVSAGFTREVSTYTPLTLISVDEGASFSVHNITASTGKRFLDMAAGLGLFVAVGAPNTIQWSYDGINWNEVAPSGGTPDYVAVTFDGSSFHAYSALTKHHAYSSDGKAWTLTTFTTGAAQVDAVIYGTSSHSGNLYQVGVDALQSTVVVEALDGDVNQELAPEYEIDYNIGDVIDVLDPIRDITATKRVYSVDHIIDKNNDYAIVPKLGKDFLTLRQLIAKEIKNNGI